MHDEFTRHQRISAGELLSVLKVHVKEYGRELLSALKVRVEELRSESYHLCTIEEILL
jgi:hypothetical protein